MVEITIFGKASLGPNQPSVDVSATGPEADLSNILSALEDTIAAMTASAGSKAILNASACKTSGIPGRQH